MTVKCGRLPPRLVCALVHRGCMRGSDMVLATFHEAGSTHTHNGFARNGGHVVLGLLDLD